jgi:hypothetical protein
VPGVAVTAPNAPGSVVSGVYGGGGAAAAGGGGGGAFLRGVLDPPEGRRVDVVVDALEVERPRPGVPPTPRVLPLAPAVCRVARILAGTFLQGKSE